MLPFTSVQMKSTDVIMCFIYTYQCAFLAMAQELNFRLNLRNRSWVGAGASFCPTWGENMWHLLWVSIIWTVDINFECTDTNFEVSVFTTSLKRAFVVAYTLKY